MIERNTTNTHVSRALRVLHQNKHATDGRDRLSFEAFAELMSTQPAKMFRDIFQLFHDMINFYVPRGVNEYPDDPESINFVAYDCSRLFIEGCGSPFFADRLFSNRLVNLANSFKQGADHNRIYLFEGTPGSGKSTFLNNLLQRFEEFSHTDEGAVYETVWRLDIEKLGGLPDASLVGAVDAIKQANGDTGHPANTEAFLRQLKIAGSRAETHIDIPCPSHDHPILQVPHAHRKEFLRRLIPDRKFRNELFKNKEYEWVIKQEPCAICTSIYRGLLDRLGSTDAVFDMLYVKRYLFDRRCGEGISVYNPGDDLSKKPLNNPVLQYYLNSLFRNSNTAEYIFSPLAKTNNGVFAIMDIKGNNRERLTKLHGVISDGVQKVGTIEEHIKSLFIAIMNPEDRDVINDVESFKDRAVCTRISYVLDYVTEVEIYKDKYGQGVTKAFLPRVLEAFAKIVIASRMSPESEGIKEWIASPDTYKRFCDKNLLLLKMSLYTGEIPDWISDDDLRSFTKNKRRRIIGESENEGDFGITGRQSIRLFGDFYARHSRQRSLVDMAALETFFEKAPKAIAEAIPEGFLKALVDLYDYSTLQEIKEALYHYNADRISRDILNYVFALNFDIGTERTCIYTQDVLAITEELLRNAENNLLKKDESDEKRLSFREDVQRKYASKTLTQEMQVEGKDIRETALYKELYERYVHNLKRNVLDPFLDNDNFRNAIRDYGQTSFAGYDKRIRDDVNFLMTNLQAQFGYTEEGAKQVCVYTIDKDIARNFTDA